MTDEKREQEETSGFKISDRRKFTMEGEVREDVSPPESPAPGVGAPNPAARQQTEPSSNREDQGKGRSPLDPAHSDSESGEAGEGMDFPSFLISLATTAMVHLGDVQDPSGQRTPPDLQAARQMIEILNMLKQKTEGNRNAEETKLLDDLLYELRMRFLTKSGGIKL